MNDPWATYSAMIAEQDAANRRLDAQEKLDRRLHMAIRLTLFIGIAAFIWAFLP